MKFATKALCLTQSDQHGAMRYPIYQNSAFETKDAKELEDIFKGNKLGHVYTRSSNPTTAEFELRVKDLSNAFGVLATSSGMGAIANTLFALLKEGDNFISTKHIFGNTLSLFDTLFEDFGVEVRYFEDESEVEGLIDERTKLLFCETVGNPQLSIINFKAIKPILAKHNILLVADTTLTPWNIIDVKSLGVDIELVSATKYISGGGHALGGLIIDYGTFNFSNLLPTYYKKFGPNAFIAKLRKETFRNLGSTLSPQNAFLLSLGLETLDLRVERSSSTALFLATELEKLGVKTAYPFLCSSPYFSIAKDILKTVGGMSCLKLYSKEGAYKF